MANNVIDNLPKSGGTCNQYCLKWNNHKLNISGVFERLRINEQFCDLTLTSADQKFVKCHRILLCAGSGYLEEILTQNQSDHPTVILSQINYDELKLLVEFTYNGEVSVDSAKLSKLLEAAKILKIKGLWESESEDLDEKEEDDKKSEEGSEETNTKIEAEQKQAGPEAKPQLVGSKKRKRKSLPSPIETKSMKGEDSPKSTGILTPKSEPGNPKAYSPMFGVSNAYFLTGQDQKPIENEDNKTTKILNDLPNLTPIHPALISAISNAAPMPFLPFLNPVPEQELEEKSKKGSKKVQLKTPDKLNLTDASGRKYKQYTEETLQQALRDIMEGQSINRSSMKYNIPARTLRDWMKRLNIKSVFTHNHGSSSPNPEARRNMSTESDCSTNTTASRESPPTVIDALPGMTIPMQVIKDKDEEEEEIDDDEENLH